MKDLETLFVVQNGALQSLKETCSEMTVGNRLQRSRAEILEADVKLGSDVSVRVLI